MRSRSARAAFAKIIDILDAEGNAAKRAFTSEVFFTLEDLKATISVPGPPRSAPYNPPHMETGELRDSYEAHVDTQGSSWTGEISSDKEYAPYLEFGTRYMSPRPHLRPAMQRMKYREPRVVATAVANAGRLEGVAKGAKVR